MLLLKSLKLLSANPVKRILFNQVSQTSAQAIIYIKIKLFRVLIKRFSAQIMVVLQVRLIF